MNLIIICTSFDTAVTTEKEEKKKEEEEGAVAQGADRADGAPGEAPPLDCTGACCHGGAKMAVLAYSLGKREINQHFTIKNAKLISTVVVILLLLFHTASRYYGGEWSPVLFHKLSLQPVKLL